MKIIAIFIITATALINSGFAGDKKLITINQFVNHIALDAAEKGVREALIDRKILPNKAQILIGNAQGSITNSVQISKHQASLNPDFMVAIATPSGQTSLRARKGKSIVAFVAVTDPVVAKLTEQQNVIGVSDAPPIADLIDFATQIFPELKNIGVIYNSGEVNSVKTIEILEQILANKNIKVKKVSITNSNDIKLALQKLVGLVDIIYVPQDNSVVSALESLVSISKSAKIPLISNDPSLVNHGVFMSYGTNYYKSGYQLGNMIADLIDGVDVVSKIQETKIRELRINKQIMQEFNIKLPEAIKQREVK